MRFTLTTILIASVLGITILSFVEMAGDGHGGQCIADFLAKTQGGFCPGESAILSYISFHFNSVKSFGAAVFDGGYVLLLFALFILVSVLSIGIIVLAPVAQKFSARVSKYIKQLSLATRKFVRWLSLCEHSPSFFIWR